MAGARSSPSDAGAAHFSLSACEDRAFPHSYVIVTAWLMTSILGGNHDALLAGDEELLVPRLVARIAELEHELYAHELKQGGQESRTGLLDKFATLLKRAQNSLDAGVAYM